MNHFIIEVKRPAIFKTAMVAAIGWYTGKFIFDATDRFLATVCKSVLDRKKTTDDRLKDVEYSRTCKGCVYDQRDCTCPDTCKKVAGYYTQYKSKT